MEGSSGDRDPASASATVRKGVQFVIGETLGHYRIIENIGSGGMGEVYRALDTRLHRPVAIKLLKTPGVERAQDRLLREARAASALNHPNICVIYEVGEADHAAFIVMEYVPGEPLNEAITHAGMPMESVTRYGIQIADALAHAHERGVIHRDLKTANIIITPQRTAKVLDFGLARRVREDSVDVTHSKDILGDSGVVVGTVPYFAPEMLQGEGADTRTDIWTLGIVLYEMATAQKPFVGRSAFEITSAILRETPAPYPSDVSSRLRSIIDRCLDKDPARRYQRAEEVRSGLEAIQDIGSAATVKRKERARPRHATKRSRIRALAVCRWRTSPATRTKNTSRTV